MEKQRFAMISRSKSYLPWALAAAAFTVAAAAGAFYKTDMTLSDAYYQRPEATDERVVIVGIDEEALNTIGPFQTWGRGVMAAVVEYLNGQEEKPAVIGLDVLFSGETEAEEDERLAEAAKAGGNVVTAAAAGFGSQMMESGAGTLYLDDFSVRSFDQSYDALFRVTGQGHINAMYDRDGILRHSLLTVTAPDGRMIPSFSMAIAEQYREWEGEGIPVDKPPVDSRGFWYLKFSGRPGDYYEFISVADLLSKKVPAEYFSGKIVLVGPYAAGLADHYMTAADHAVSMYGVEIQANAIHCILESDYKREAGEGVQLAVLFFVLSGLAVWFRGRRVIPAAAVWLAVLGGSLIAAKAAWECGIVVHVSYIPIGATVFFIVSVAANYVRASAEKRRVMTTFRRYVAPEIVDEIVRQGLEHMELGGRLCDIAVLFVDIRGFTSMSEVLTPPQVVEILNRYLSLTSSCIMRRKGTLDKFIGDATMAFWGAPLPQEDYIMNAVKAARDMAEGARELSRELEERFGRTVSFGIGIHAGPAVVGNIGASSRMDYTAIGDTVNTASRLESNAPGGAIYISRAVAEALKGRIRVVSLGDTIKLKGKAEGFEVLRLEEILEAEAETEEAVKRQKGLRKGNGHDW